MLERTDSTSVSIVEIKHLVTKSCQPGRNAPCPCGSGKKFKRCHGGSGLRSGSPSVGRSVDARLRDKLAWIQAQQLQREKQQGLGRPIISEVFQDYRIVAVGNRVLYSKDWRTFHDFLFHYIAKVFGQQWGAAELAKPESARHPLLRLYGLVEKFRRERKGPPGATVYTAPMTGAVAAYLHLAYNLYLLAHNVSLQERLVERLRKADQFHPAAYETYVAAAFIKAGFQLDIENEADLATTHCEFSATWPMSGRNFSVEAKARQPGKRSAGVTNQLHAALKKQATHEHVVFIDVNVPVASSSSDRLPWLSEALAGIRRKESTLTIKGKPAPGAYVVLTNRPYDYELESEAPALAAAAEGFKIPDFKMDSAFRNLHEALLAREKHREMFQLLESMFAHDEIPTTFDGAIPEFAFGDATSRLLIGHRYLIPDAQGLTKPGTLLDATVSEAEGKALGVFRLDDGTSVLVSCVLAPEELSAYHRHPDTFFGVHRRQSRRADSPIELYDFFMGVYRDLSKESLLELMREQPDIEELRTKGREELAAAYSERLAESAARRALRTIPSQ